jgi:aspartate/methionine/tyrosine aminotransferase
VRLSLDTRVDLPWRACPIVVIDLTLAPLSLLRFAPPCRQERTLTVSSAGKTFSATGWKVGWVVGPAPLVQRVANVSQWVTYCVPTVMQEAVAEALRKVRAGPLSLDVTR